MNEISQIINIGVLKKTSKKIAILLEKISPNLSKIFIDSCYKVYAVLCECSRFCAFANPCDCDYVKFVDEKVKKYNPLVSVIVPNFNHAIYLKERLDSIYNQTYKNYEVILLDDCSTDNSRNILTEYQIKHQKYTRCIFNDINSGVPFIQWDKGMANAQGDLIWIAESDDYCDSDFLDKMVQHFQHDGVMLAFSRSIFVKDGKKIGGTDTYLADLPRFPTEKSFYMTGSVAVKKAFVYKNIIPNVSSAMFRNTGEFLPEEKNIWEKLKLCGDWIFYLNMIRGGVLAYVQDTTNYYRVHEKSTSLKIQHENTYYKEYQIVAEFIVQHFRVDINKFKTVKDILIKHYLYFYPKGKATDIDQWYNLEMIAKATNHRKMSVALCGYSMIMGGGETFPIFLANALRTLGLTVTFIDYNIEGRDIKVRNMLSRSIPCLDLKEIHNGVDVIINLDVDIMHSHNTMIDELVARVIKYYQLPSKQVITLHGMYESSNDTNSARVISFVKGICSSFVYTTKKNLTAFQINSIVIDEKFCQIGNGLPIVPINPIKRKDLDIEEDAFVLCLVSRAIPEKGWKEAIEIITKARELSGNNIHLLLIGEGEEYSCLKKVTVPDYIHLLGNQEHIRDYFACSDMGFLPSRFKGESFPLVIIDVLLAGKPVLASDIGEIKKQISDKNGNCAGMVFPLYNWKIPVEDVAKMVADISNKDKKYRKMLDNVNIVNKKFDIKEVAKKYMSLFENVIGEG